MSTLTTTLFSFVVWWCVNGVCSEQSVILSPEATAIAACESGNTVELGTLDWKAVNVNKNGTNDRGAWQFNSYWVWNAEDQWIIRPAANSIGLTSDKFLELYPTPNLAPPSVQYAVFKVLWDSGYGWTHWKASQPCWSQWLEIDGNGRAVWR
jgi:hypothetical protein